MATEYTNIDPANPPKPQTAKIWKTFGILVGITAFEFLCAFTIAKGNMLIAIFIVLTIVRAFFIVANFMHLKYETKPLIYSILIMPVILMMWLTYILIYESVATYKMNNDYNNTVIEQVEDTSK